MKIFVIRTFFILIFKLTYFLTQQNNLKYLTENIPDIDIENYDVREKFYDCYNEWYDGDYIV